MRSALLLWTTTLGLTGASVVLGGDRPAGGKETAPATAPTPAEAARQILDQKITLDYVGASLDEIVNHLQQKTKLNVAFDRLMQRAAFNPNGNPGQFHLETGDRKLGQAIRAFLEPLGLTYVVLADRVLITSEQMAPQRQLQQPVSLNVDAIPLRDALRRLGRQTGANVVLDPAAAKQAQAPVTLRLDDTPLENAVRLLTEVGGLKSLRMDNVLFVTTEEKASKLRKEAGGRQPVPEPSPYYSPAPGRAPMLRDGPAGGFGVKGGPGGKARRGVPAPGAAPQN